MEHELPVEDAVPSLRLILPAAPESEEEEVKAWEESVEMSSYLPDVLDLNPMFFERRIYQDGEVYPLPHPDHIATEPVIKSWKAIHVENRYIRLMLLPEMGGRIHVGLDKISGYDFSCRQRLIKSAPVGLAEPWPSGGVDFNWPHHHSAKFMPVETEIERHQDGSVTVWCSNYDRASGIRGLHGVCLHPDSTVVESKNRLYNGTETMQTFLWPAKIVGPMSEDFQAFFPPDVRHSADQAKHAVSAFPLGKSSGYGIDYTERAQQAVSEGEAPVFFEPHGFAQHHQSIDANMAVPTSYMVVRTDGHFFGGYDHAANAGFVHVANRHIAPGKKQWTLENQNVGYARDRSFTAIDSSSLQPMAGFYTDSQPEFCSLAPGETKTFNQFLYPLRNCGVPLAANLDAAIRLEANGRTASLAVSLTRDLPDAILMLKHGSHLLELWEQDLTVEEGFAASVALPEDCATALLSLELRTAMGEVLNCSLAPQTERPSPATFVELELPEAVASLDELFLIGLHLEQSRHATRSAESYWREAIDRDAGDVRCNHALAKLHLRRGEYALAEGCIRAAIARASRFNENACDGEIFYTLGLILRRLNRIDEAYAALHKATRNHAWRSAGYHAVAEIDAVRNDLEAAIRHIELSLLTNADNLNARNLCASLLRRLDRDDEASDLLAHTSDLDRLDLWSRFLDGVDLPQDSHQLLSLGLLMERSGQVDDAIEVLSQALRFATDGSLPLLNIAIARCCASLGDHAREERHLTAATVPCPDSCFPSGLEHLHLVEYASTRRPDAARLHFYLGNLRFHHGHHEQAIASWQRSVQIDDSYSPAWRNLGAAYINIRRDSLAAQQAFDRALDMYPEDTRLVCEREIHASELENKSATIDYSTTPLTASLLFEEDMDDRQTTDAALLRSIASNGFDSMSESPGLEG